MPAITRPIALLAMAALLVTACATQPRYDNTGAYQSYCTTCGTVERISKVRESTAEGGYRFDVQLQDGRRAQVTQLDRHGLRVGDSVMIRDAEVRLRR